MISFRIVLAACLCVSVFAGGFFLRDCSGSDAWAKLLSARISPHPIPLDAEFKAGGSAKFFKDLKGAELDIDVDLKRKLPILGFTSIPCPGNFNCHYDACTFANRLVKDGQCPPLFRADKLPCTCDTIKAGTYTLNDRETKMELRSSILSILGSGTYSARVTVKDRKTGKEVGCLDAQFELESCKGFLCSIIG